MSTYKKRMMALRVLVLCGMLVNVLAAQKDVLLPYLKTNECYVGETVTTTDKRFQPLDVEMGWYKLLNTPVYFMGLKVDEAQVTIEKGVIVNIMLFMAPADDPALHQTVLDEKLGKLNLKKGEERLDHYWRTSQYEIILRSGISKNIIYLQPVSAPLNDSKPGSKD